MLIICGKENAEIGTQLVTRNAERICRDGGYELEEEVAAVFLLVLLEELATGDFAAGSEPLVVSRWY